MDRLTNYFTVSAHQNETGRPFRTAPPNLLTQSGPYLRVRLQACHLSRDQSRVQKSDAGVVVVNLVASVVGTV